MTQPTTTEPRWPHALTKVIEQRDRARDLAAHLEAKLARVEQLCDHLEGQEMLREYLNNPAFHFAAKTLRACLLEDS